MKKLLPLTGIRALAAIWVVLFHLNLLFDYGFLNPLVAQGYLGVDLFFILSGFIISYVHQQELKVLNWATTFRFLGLRVARIFPVHYAMLFMMLAFFSIKGILAKDFWIIKEVGTAQEFIYNLLNIQSWGMMVKPSCNQVAWSVSAEWFAYLCFPLITPLLARTKSPWANFGLMMVCFTLLLIFFCFMGPFEKIWFRYSLIRVLMEFIIGCALFNIYRRMDSEPFKASWWGWFMNGLLVCFLGGIWLQLPGMIMMICMVPLLYGVALGHGWMSRFLSTRGMVYLGEISFSVYMVHGFMVERLQVLNQKIHFVTSDASIQNIMAFMGILLGILLAAQLMYQWVEVPCRNLIRAWLDKGLPSRHHDGIVMTTGK